MPFLKLASSRRPLAEGENPLTLFERVRNRSAFLLQSSDGGVKGGYSFIGYDPFAKLWSSKGVTHLLKLKDFFDWEKSPVQIFDGEPLEVLRELTRHFRFNGKSPVPFCGGAAGYFSYDFGAGLGGVQQKVFDDQELPDFVFFFADKIFAVDHEKSELCCIALAPTDAEAQRKLEEMADDLQVLPAFVQAGTVGSIEAQLTYDQYVQKLSIIHDYLKEGDTYQVNFSQRFSAECSRDPWSVYKNLAAVNPAPYSCFFDCEDFQIISSSPELLLSKTGSKVVTKPIKGTVPRGKNKKEDAQNVEKLLASEKDAAELAMIVDLERNDLGKVCDPGSVRVVEPFSLKTASSLRSEYRTIEKYARVIHTVSTIEGRLLHSKDFFDAFAALFPGGSITGCPKKRTMEIIDELEDFRRGVYTGSAGYVGFDGNGAMNILIRTMLLQNNKLLYQAGGGIVIDSDPRQEYEECFSKAKALREALENHENVIKFKE